MPAIRVVPSTVEDPAGDHEQARLGQAVAEHVQEGRGQRESPADRGRQREQAHVLDAGVGEHPFEVALPDDQRGGHGEGQQSGRDQQAAHQARTEHRVDDGLHPQDGVERDGQEHAGHQPGHRGRRLAVRVGQPAVHRSEARLGGEPEDGQRAGHPEQRRVERETVLGQDEPGQGGTTGGDGGGVEQDEPEEGDRYPDRAEDDVLPGRLERLRRCRGGRPGTPWRWWSPRPPPTGRRGCRRAPPGTSRRGTA